MKSKAANPGPPERRAASAPGAGATGGLRPAALLLLVVLALGVSCQGQQPRTGTREAPPGEPPGIVDPARLLERPPPEAALPGGPGLTYSTDTLYFDGKAVHLWSGELPYYRIDPAVWGERLDAAKAAGVRFITAYVPWNLHEAREGRFDFDGSGGDPRTNLVGFIELVAARGMYFIPKPGPFICAEVHHGGIPDWVTDQDPEVVMRDFQGRPVLFRQDGTPLPDHLNTVYLQRVYRWYRALYTQVLSRYQHPRGPVVALQVENELLYSTSGLASPFAWGYTAAVQGLYRRWLAETYGSIGHYNEVHGTKRGEFAEISAPRPAEWRFRRPSDWLVFQDWVRFKDWYGAAVLRRYVAMLRSLGVTVPLYHNAGMLEDEAPMNFGSVSQEVWLGVNFWLHPNPMYSDASYVRGSRRLKQLRGSQPTRPSIAPEVNWGWGRGDEADFLTRYTLPYTKATNVYPLSDSTDAGTLGGVPYSTSRQPYPGEAPIDAQGNLRPAYRRLQRLVRYTDSEGQDFAEAQPLSAIGLASYAPYNAAALYTGYGRARAAALNRVFLSAISTNEFLQAVMKGLVEQDAECAVVDLQHGVTGFPGDKSMLIVLSQEFMDTSAQSALARYVRAGGVLVLMPTVPAVDLDLRPAPLLRRELLPGLVVTDSRRLAGHREFIAEGSGLRFAGSRVVHNLGLTGGGWSILARSEGGEIVAAERREGRGTVAYIGTYTTDPVLYLWLARKAGVTARYAYCEDAEVEVVPIANPRSGATYLFVLNRSPMARFEQIRALDPTLAGGWHSFATEVGGHSISILKVREGRLQSASLCGGEAGAFLSSESQRIVFPRAAQADLLRRQNGDLLLWADRATDVLLGDVGEGNSAPVKVVTEDGRTVAATRVGAELRFHYDPAGNVASLYRLSRGGAP
jgi:beta-galactosidase